MGFKFLNSHFTVPCYFTVSLISIVNNVQDNTSVRINKTGKIKRRSTSGAVYAIGAWFYEPAEVSQVVIQTGICDFFRTSVNYDHRMLPVIIRIPMLLRNKPGATVLIQNHVPVNPGRDPVF